MRLFELRREPNINVKATTIEQMRKYSGNNNITVSFSPIQKIGIYPMSDWDTPNGVYAYQLNQYKSMLDARDSIDGIFPFGSERPYIFVLETTASNPLNFDKNISDADFNKYIHFIMQQFNVPQEEIDVILSDRQKRRLPTNSQQLYYMMRKVLFDRRTMNMLSHNSSTNTFNKLLRIFGFDAVIDNGHGVLHSGVEPIQVVYLTPSAYKIKDTIRNDLLHREDRHHVYGRGNKHNKKQLAAMQKVGQNNNDDDPDYDLDVPF